MYLILCRHMSASIYVAVCTCAVYVKVRSHHQIALKLRFGPPHGGISAFFIYIRWVRSSCNQRWGTQGIALLRPVGTYCARTSNDVARSKHIHIHVHTHTLITPSEHILAAVLYTLIVHNILAPCYFCKLGFCICVVLALGRIYVRLVGRPRSGPYTP